MIEALRTPASRFRALPDFPWQPEYADDLAGFDGLRLAYLDLGPAQAEHAFLCLHGEPTWSFLYRKLIPAFLAAGHRVVAPDFFGFGRSDKPVADPVYTFDFHRQSLLRLLDALGLERVVLVCQDWGGILGLTLPLDLPHLVSHLFVMNTNIADGHSPGEGFLRWRELVRAHPDFDAGRLMGSAVPGITQAEQAAYDAPFPDQRFQSGVRRFPELVPITPEMPGAELGRRAVSWWSTEWSGPSFMAVGAQDPVLGPPVMNRLQTRIRGCPAPLILEDAGHFVQEHGEPLALAGLEALGLH